MSFDDPLAAAFTIAKAEPDPDSEGDCTLTLEAKKAFKYLSYNYSCMDAEGVKIDDGNDILQDVAVGDKVKSELLCDDGTKKITAKLARTH